jgi:hypothetical protein
MLIITSACRVVWIDSVLLNLELDPLAWCLSTSMFCTRGFDVSRGDEIVILFTVMFALL